MEYGEEQQKKNPPVSGLCVQEVGVEPTRVLSPLDFESSASANSATPALFRTVLWARRDLNSRHPACKAGALDQLSYSPFY